MHLIHEMAERHRTAEPDDSATDREWEAAWRSIAEEDLDRWADMSQRFWQSGGGIAVSFGEVMDPEGFRRRQEAASREMEAAAAERQATADDETTQTDKTDDDDGDEDQESPER